jgi:hypothetical protein
METMTVSDVHHSLLEPDSKQRWAMRNDIAFVMALHCRLIPSAMRSTSGRPQWR